MTSDDEVLKKIRIRQESIIKNGTYTIDSLPSDVEEELPSLPSDVEMPPTAEQFIQSNVDELLRDYAPDSSAGGTASIDDAQSLDDVQPLDEDKIAEIMNKFSSNIQDNVNRLFDDL